MKFGLQIGKDAYFCKRIKKCCDMQNLTDIFSRRLKQARVLRKLSMDQLCSLMNGVVTKQSIHKYETGKMMPNDDALIALSEALCVDSDYFFRPFTFDVEAFEVSFRKKSSVGKKDISALKVKIQNDVEKYLEVESVLGKEDAELVHWEEVSSIGSREQMIQLAQRVRVDWELGKSPITNVLDLLESKGIKVIMVEADDDFDGLSGVINGKHAIIVLNKNQDFVERRRFTALHELAHLLFDSKFSGDLDMREKENLCHVFANEMLVSSDVLTENFEKGAKVPTAKLKLLQQTYGISIDAIMQKLKQLEIISESRYTGYCIHKKSNQKLNEFVMKSRFQEPITNRFESMVYSAVSLNLITLSKAASLLQESISSVRKKANDF